MSATRGTCQACGRWVITYTRKDDSALRARGHKAFVGSVGTEREWKECTGSNQPVKA